MAEVTTNFRDSSGGDLGKNLVSREYLQAVYPKLASQLLTGTLYGTSTSLDSTTSPTILGNNSYLNLPSGAAFTYAPKSDWIFAHVSSITNVIAINSDGTLWGCGENPPGFAGNTSTPIQEPSLSTWKTASTSQTNTIAIKKDGTLWVRGGSLAGQYSTTWTTDTGWRQEHTNSNNWKEVCLHGHTSSTMMGIKSDGSLWTWGDNGNYLLSRSFLSQQVIPAQYTSVSSIAREYTSSTWKKVSVSNRTAFGIKTDGSLWGWGFNGNNNLIQFGAIGSPTGSSYSLTGRNRIYTPIPFQFGITNWVTIPTTITGDNFPSSGITNYCHNITTDGRLFGWGCNLNGALCTGDLPLDNRRPNTPIREISNSTNWKQVDSCYGVNAASGTVWGLKTDGSLWFWGANYGNFAVGRQISSSPRPAGVTNDWKQISVSTQGGGYAQGIYALKNDGTIWWKGSILGMPLGINNSGFSSSGTFTQEKSLRNDWKSVCVGRDHVVAIDTSGRLWSWGDNFEGQLGNNTTTDSTIPVQEWSSSTNWVQASTGSRCTVAVKSDGTIWGWGNGSDGKLGIIDTPSVSRRTPVQEFTSSTNWRMCQVSSHTLAIKTDGTLWAWGRNVEGQLGINSPQSFIYTPVQEFTSSNNWNYICRQRGETSAAVKNDRTMWIWGSNDFSQTSLQSYYFVITPAKEWTDSKWNDVAVGRDYVCAIKDNGTLWVWGTSTPMQMITSSKSWKSCSVGQHDSAFTSSINALATDGTLLSPPLSSISNNWVFLAKGSGASAQFNARCTTLGIRIEP